MSLLGAVSVKKFFKMYCEDLINEDLPKGTKVEEKNLPEVLFEGLADVENLPDSNFSTYFINGQDQQNGHYCIISGRCRVGKGDEAVAIAIGLWVKERRCFSALAKMKDGKRLPLPFQVKGVSIADACENARLVFNGLECDEGLENAVNEYKDKAKQYQK